MATIRRQPHRQENQSGARRIIIAIFLFLFVVIIYFAVGPDELSDEATLGHTGNEEDRNDHHGKVRGMQKIRNSVADKRRQLRDALKSLTKSSHLMPARLRLARENNEIVGEYLSKIRDGTETVEEILHTYGGDGADIDKPPMTLDEIIEYLTNWIHLLHETLIEVKLATQEDIWQAYHDLTVKTLYPWDRDYLSRMPQRRDDNSLFVSVATYRDENCIHTLTAAYEKAKDPDKLFIGLVQQNCHRDCKTGVLAGGKVEDTEPDGDCFQLFCDTDIGQNHCDQIRVINIDEPESLGPYAARFIASKLWYGEQWYMQIDAHMTFATHWDQRTIKNLQNAPSEKPVISHYPPPHNTNLDEDRDKPGARICGPIFATSDLESQIIRLEESGVYDTVKLDIPRFAPFVAAGYFVAHSSFLNEVPFDPFLPWIFMGEEIIMSTRLWTSGYDIFSPNENILGHIYGRRHKPKFWESVHRTFSPGMHNPLQMMILDRIKYQLGYPEASKDVLQHKSLLTAVEQYTMGTERSLHEYLSVVGLNMTTKQTHNTEWCFGGQPPPNLQEKYGRYYTNDS